MSNHEKSSEDIRREIEHTRSALGDTVDAIQDRLKPDNLRAQAQEAIQSTLTDTADSIVNYVTGHRSELQSSLIDTIKRNPLPSLLIGAGVGWLLVDMLSSSGNDVDYPNQRYDRDRARMVQRTRDYDRHEQSDAGYNGSRYANGNADNYANGNANRYDNGHQSDGDNWVQSATHSAQDKIGDVAGAVQDAAVKAGGAMQDAAANVGDALQGAAAKAGDAVQETTGAMGDKAQRSAGKMGDQAQSYARSAQRTTQRTISDNPLLFSAIALGAGATIALLLPNTRQEDQWMGELSDQVTENATAAAVGVAQRARTVIEEVAPEVKQAVQRLAEDVKQTGQESLEQVKKSTAEAVDKVQNKTESTVKSEAEKAKQDVQRYAQEGKEAVLA